MSEGSDFSAFSLTLILWPDSGHPGGREVVFQCDFDLHFPSDQKYPVSFLVLIGHFIFGKTYSSPLLILKLDYLFFLLLSCRNSLY